MILPLSTLKFLVALALIFAGSLAQGMPLNEPCPATGKSRVWSASCFEISKAGRQVKQQYKPRLQFDRRGFAAVVIEAPPELVAINRAGFIVQLKEDRMSYFHFEPGEGTIARFIYRVGNNRNSSKFKCGYYRSDGYEIVVPPVYDQCDSFVKGKALVCIGCKNYCESGDCHQSNYAGGEGILINENHEVLKRFPLPALPRCEGHSAEHASDKGDKKCRPREPNPFDKLM